MRPTARPLGPSPTSTRLLLLAAPLTAGLSLAPAAPVALAQAALAVHTTRLTGRLTAAELLRSAERGQQRPGSLLRRLARQDPQVRAWLVQMLPEGIQTRLPVTQTAIPQPAS